MDDTMQDARRALLGVAALDGQDGAERWVRACVAYLGEGFHPDTPFADYLTVGRERVFTDDEAEHCEGLMYRAEELLGDCCSVALAAVRDRAREIAEPSPKDLAVALLTLWGIEGSECAHGVGLDRDCDDDCVYNEVRPALRAARTLL